MFKRILVTILFFISIFSISSISAFTEFSKKASVSKKLFDDPCYSEIVYRDGKKYLIEYDCDGSIIRVTELFD